MTGPRRNPRGFTLLEVMVTMAIGSVLLLVAATLLGGAGQTYDRGSGSVAAEREARAVLTQLGEDFSKAEWHDDTVFEPQGEGWKQDRVGFLSLQPDDAQSKGGRTGDLCALHYYVKDIEVGNSVVRCLMRGFHESGEVFPELLTGSVGSLFDEQDVDEPVAFGVLSFEATPLVLAEATGKYEDWKPGGAEPQPDAVRVRLVIARRELLGKLTSTKEWDSSPLRGNPTEAANNRDLEVYEVIQRFGNNA
ncbi:PulJ/GspJ family protein [Luteolibacter marinus]|uniref:PulJ/GspJ family protein n=1 Tax=Luteolibacter marinus TaxID=2776705 RepID=UPI0018683C61|nr:prepilin-type N-terminal cleavage/methylation domain-containing protein [Luteolibacter marinus]